MVLVNVFFWEVKITLARSRAGHLPVNLTQDLLTMREGAYMVRSLSFEKASGETEVHIIPNMHMSEINTPASAVVALVLGSSLKFSIPAEDFIPTRADPDRGGVWRGHHSWEYGDGPATSSSTRFGGGPSDGRPRSFFSSASWPCASLSPSTFPSSPKEARALRETFSGGSFWNGAI